MYIIALCNILKASISHQVYYRQTNQNTESASGQQKFANQRVYLSRKIESGRTVVCRAPVRRTSKMRSHDYALCNAISFLGTVIKEGMLIISMFDSFECTLNEQLLHDMNSSATQTLSFFAWRYRTICFPIDYYREDITMLYSTRMKP